MVTGVSVVGCSGAMEQLGGHSRKIWALAADAMVNRTQQIANRRDFMLQLLYH
jgi:hypothetical protein